MIFDDIVNVMLPQPGPSVTLVFGRIDSAGAVILEPGDTVIDPPPPSLTPLTPNSRFAALMQGRPDAAQTLLIIGLIGGGATT